MFVRRLLTAGALAAAVISFPTSAAAQQIGVKAGVNFANLTNADNVFGEDTQRIGLVGGLFVTVPATERFSFQIEGLYTEKGVKFEDTIQGVNIEADVRLRYFEVPVLGRANFTTSGSSTNFYVIAGAAPAFKLGAHVNAEAAGEEESEDIGDDVESFDLGLVGGAGVEFGNFVIDGRYTHGLMSISADDDSDDDEDDVKNRVFTVTVGYRFR